ncbi:DUF4224 domain-containing protein [Achromobacter mucicolens]|uniref:DUF4224 domain-containing protein n=1 Tax=Achromobacter mucicolens TaxID=1389922 RepID=A0ABM8LKT6_9BURK|nr:DUF4224 domain-containing protein [Achromobacter mucicolens]CAB3917559.1 hypothetical protein LMG3415_05324 [Achromobacter mucicolens]
MLTLTEKEIGEITARQRRPAQMKVLKALGIRYQVRPDGSLLVYRRYVDKGHTDTIPSREPQMRLRNGPTAQI